MLRAVLRALRPTVLLLIVLAACAALVAGCGSDDDKTSGSTATQAETTPAETETTTTPDEDTLAPPKDPLDASKRWTAVVSTNMGKFTIVLDVKRAPKTTSSFAYLAQQGFYNQLVFHRIVPDFVIQGGDPTGTGSGGPGYSVVEAPPQDLTYTHGIVAMAKAGDEPPGASGSQFFVVTGQDGGLPPEYALVGKVKQGLDVVDKIGSVPLQQGTESPVDPVTISSIKIVGS